MNIFENIKKGIPKNIRIPEELKKLCEWTEKNGYPISGCFELRGDDGETMRYWLGFDDVSDRFGLFGAGASGDIYAFWLDDTGNQKIVHLGSEGDAIYILADNFIGFLKLLAIGYDEIGFADMNLTVEEWNLNVGNDKNEGINPKFMNWVEQEFQVKVPKKGNEIADFSNKEFHGWINEQLKKYS
ncbi:hypothetical protein J0X14_06660 [Muricauda sp. CAU 1633]|uniref:hypothetical protein n=1 Tax=Allomuricauda sp. CAU 1633 TaxID=2816036 RepID=UPI001A8D1221|nr:hypothetical protein [Muricauda sp. CAU 1633]MBO0321970.1 hypothetical protein [Muricauda sp. CAU 1633]